MNLLRSLRRGFKSHWLHLMELWPSGLRRCVKVFFFARGVCGVGDNNVGEFGRELWALTKFGCQIIFQMHHYF